MPDVLVVINKSTKLQRLKAYADEKSLKATYCYLYNRLFQIYETVLDEANHEAIAEELKSLLEEIEP
ncbi:MAG: hypothetical protein ACOY9Y_02240 [Bacillota bacterium]